MSFISKLTVLPPSPHSDPRYVKKEGLVNLVSIITIGSASLLLIGCVIFGFSQGTIVLSIAVPFYFITYLWFRQRRNYIFTINTGLCVLSVAILISCWYSGLLTSPVMFWLITLPMYAFWLLNTRYGFMWLLVALGLEAVILAVGLNGYAPVRSFDFYTKENVGLLFFLNTTLIILIAIFSYDYESGQVKTIKKIEAEKVSLEDTLAKLAHITAELRRAEKHKDLFLAQMSHELRTPMNAIIGMSELWREKLSGESAQDVNIINHSAKNLLGILDDILDITRIQSGRFSFNYSTVELKSLIETVLSSHEKNAKEKNIELFLHLDKKIPRTISTDPTRLAQVMNNVLSNAVKFTNTGSIKFSLGWEKIKKKDHLIIIAEDTGIGIDKAHQATIFQPFTQANEDIYKKYGGSGLGLSICAQLVSHIGGDIKLDSKPGKGTRIQIAFPVLRSKKEVTLPQNELTNEILRKLSQITILLVDDADINRQVVIKSIKNKVPEIKIIEAENGQLALHLLESEMADVILMDVQMPIMDGITATKRIRMSDNTRIQNTVIIGLSAYAMNEDKSRCIEAGMNDYISKPFNTNELLLKIFKHVSAR